MMIILALLENMKAIGFVNAAAEIQKWFASLIYDPARLNLVDIAREQRSPPLKLKRKIIRISQGNDSDGS